MTKASVSDTRKRIGRPPVGSTGVMVRLPPDQLAAVDNWAASEGIALSRPEAVRRLVAKGLERHAGQIKAEARLARLTTREREVLSGMADGLTNKEIGSKLEISPRTVEIHRTNALSKLGARNSTDAVRTWLEADKGFAQFSAKIPR